MNYPDEDDSDDEEVVTAKYNRWTTFQSDDSMTLDTPMWLPN